MNSAQLRINTTNLVSALSFAHLVMRPHFFHNAVAPAYVQLNVQHLAPPLDGPIHDMATGTDLRPSECISMLFGSVVPTAIISVQAIAEEALNDKFGDELAMAARLRSLIATGTISSSIHDRAQHWRLVRNVVGHGNGVVSKATEAEAAKLKAKAVIAFDVFVTWGRFLDTARGGEEIASGPLGNPVPLTGYAFRNPKTPPAPLRTPIRAGHAVEVGLADVMAAADTWADVMSECGI